MNPTNDALTGNLREISLCDVIQLVALGGRDGVIRLESDEARGALWFAAGRIVRAELGARSGEHAFYAAMMWDNGTFAVAFDAACPGENINAAAYPLLMEGARRIDECNRIRRELEADRYPLVLTNASTPHGEIESAVAHLFRAPCHVDLAIRWCAIGELEVLTAIARLVEAGWLQRVVHAAA